MMACGDYYDKVMSNLNTVSNGEGCKHDAGFMI